MAHDILSSKAITKILKSVLRKVGYLKVFIPRFSKEFMKVQARARILCADWTSASAIFVPRSTRLAEH